MPRYYFHLRKGNQVAHDEEGMDLREMEAVQNEAAHALSDLARDAIREASALGVACNLTIEVRDENGLVMQVRFQFAIKRTPTVNRRHRGSPADRQS
ncbi:DUF6894 family protein [Bradyrhizobium sp. PMVTL-01]|uniref:DUF6894 family protein n=1 Tax=Bradyrhizobium sp. PMVTL-01 TaxID=3434999 RepID=UPI003F70C403